VLTYIDSSVVLAYLLAEIRVPAAEFWRSALTSSRLLEYEVWNRIHARQLGQSRRDEARTFLTGVQLIEMSEAALACAVQPFPFPVRTLDSLHLTTCEFLRMRCESVELASYDNRLLAAARALAIPIVTL
jgi:predicted nucleic acid-binding protein